MWFTYLFFVVFVDHETGNKTNNTDNNTNNNTTSNTTNNTGNSNSTWIWKQKEHGTNEGWTDVALYLVHTQFTENLCLAHMLNKWLVGRRVIEGEETALVIRDDHSLPAYMLPPISILPGYDAYIQ